MIRRVFSPPCARACVCLRPDQASHIGLLQRRLVLSTGLLRGQVGSLAQ